MNVLPHNMLIVSGDKGRAVFPVCFRFIPRLLHIARNMYHHSVYVAKMKYRSAGNVAKRRNWRKIPKTYTSADSAQNAGTAAFRPVFTGLTLARPSSSGDITRNAHENHRTIRPNVAAPEATAF